MNFFWQCRETFALQLRPLPGARLFTFCSPHSLFSSFVNSACSQDTISMNVSRNSNWGEMNEARKQLCAPPATVHFPVIFRGHVHRDTFVVLVRTFVWKRARFVLWSPNLLFSKKKASMKVQRKKLFWAPRTLCPEINTITLDMASVAVVVGRTS